MGSWRAWKSYHSPIARAGWAEVTLTNLAHIAITVTGPSDVRHMLPSCCKSHLLATVSRFVSFLALELNTKKTSIWLGRGEKYFCRQEFILPAPWNPLWNSRPKQHKEKGTLEFEALLTGPNCPRSQQTPQFPLAACSSFSRPCIITECQSFTLTCYPSSPSKNVSKFWITTLQTNDFLWEGKPWCCETKK